jgi:hypothetical protein
MMSMVVVGRDHAPKVVGVSSMPCTALELICSDPRALGAFHSKSSYVTVREGFSKITHDDEAHLPKGYAWSSHQYDMACM